VAVDLHYPPAERPSGTKKDEEMNYRIAEEHRRFSIQVSKNGKDWHDLHPTTHIPRYFDSLEDARSWVDTIRKGVVYHDADAPEITDKPLKRFWVTYRFHNQSDASIHEDEVFANGEDEAINKVIANHNHQIEWHTIKDAPNIAQDERKAEGGESMPRYELAWFKKRIGSKVMIHSKKGSICLRTIENDIDAGYAFNSQFEHELRYSDPS
jgi:hypothetical protein